MNDMPNVVLVIGDQQLGKDTVVRAKAKYKSFYWETLSATEKSCDEIRMASSFIPLGYSHKTILINDLPNKKQVRDFILDLVSSASNTMKFVIWDSTDQIRIDPKTGINKTWQSWIDDLKKINGFTLVNNGGDFAENDSKDSTSYVQGLFQKRNRTIDNISAKLFVDLVGKNRAMLSSEVSKLSLISPQVLTKEFILENTFPTSKEAVLYKLGNDLDSNNYSRAITSLENFIHLGINPNVIAHIISNKARWNLVICHLWSQGLDWPAIREEILGMGKFPSCVWHNDQLSDSQKKKLATDLSDQKNMNEFIVKVMGLPDRCIEYQEEKSATNTVKRGEVIPMPFIADMMVNYVKGMVSQNRSNISDKELRERLLDRSLNVYLSCTESLKEIRYSTDDSVFELYEMVKAWTNPTL